MSTTNNNLQFMCYCDGTHGATSFTDDSKNSLTITNNQTSYASLDTGVKQLGTASIILSTNRLSDIAVDYAGALTSTSRIYGMELAVGTRILNATRNILSSVLNSGDTGSPNFYSYTDLTSSITGQDAGDTIIYGASDIRIDNSGGQFTVNKDFTFSAFVRINTYAGIIVDFGSLRVEVNSSQQIEIWNGLTKLFTSTLTISNSTFTHFEFSRYGKDLYIYFDGILDTTYEFNEFALTDYSIIEIGNMLSGLGSGFDGYIDEIQIWTDLSLHNMTGKFTVPTSQFSDSHNSQISSIDLQVEIETYTDIEVSNIDLQVEVETYTNIQVSGIDLQAEVIEFPNLITLDATDLTPTSATLNGTFFSGIEAVTEMGFVYSTTTGPTTSDTKSVITTESGTLTSDVTSLSASQTYYVRAFLTDSIDTYYGNEISFTTLANSQEGLFLQVLEFQESVTADTGTSASQVVYTDHGLVAGDMIVNSTRRTVDAERGSRVVGSVGLTSSVIPITSNLSGQTDGDSILLFKYIDRTDLVKIKTLKVNRRSNGRTEINWTFVTTNEYVPRVGSFIKLNYVEDGTTYNIFRGRLRTATRRMASEANNVIFLECNAVGLNNICTSRTISVNYSSGTLYGDIVSDMVTNYLFQESITLGNIDDGLALEVAWVEDAISIQDVLDQCAAKSAYQWFIDDTGNMQFYAEPSSFTDCTYTLEEGEPFVDYFNLTYNETLENYLNKVFVIGGNDERGNQIVLGSEDFDKSTLVQQTFGGTGVYGMIHRDTSIIETDYLTTESGTTTTNVTITGHGQAVGDIVWNFTRSEFRTITEVVDVDNFTVDAVTSQTTGDIIATFDTANDIIQNMLKTRGTFLPATLEFTTRHPMAFNPSERLFVNIPKLRILNEYFLIEEVEVYENFDLFATVRASLRGSGSNFSTQRMPNYIDYFRG